MEIKIKKEKLKYYGVITLLVLSLIFNTRQFLENDRIQTELDEEIEVLEKENEDLSKALEESKKKEVTFELNIKNKTVGVTYHGHKYILEGFDLKNHLFSKGN